MKTPWSERAARTMQPLPLASPGNSAANRIPAAPSLVVSGLNLSAIRVTEQRGSASAMQTAVETPTTPAPTTATLTVFICNRESGGGGSDKAFKWNSCFTL